MVLDCLKEMVNEKIETDSMLSVSIECDSSHVLEAFVPYSINTEDGIYIEGESFLLNITNEEAFTIDYDETEDEFIIKQGSTIFYLG